MEDLLFLKVITRGGASSWHAIWPNAKGRSELI
jgi:hypothetical protein